MSNRRIVSVAAVSTSGTAYTGRADGLFSTNDQAKLKQAGNWPTAIAAPSAPTIGTATAGNTQISVAFTAPSSLNGSTITGYTVTSSPGGFTGTGTSSPIIVTGLSYGTSYTFTVVANSASGASIASASSSSITLTLPTYADDVFSTYLYTGNGSTQTINNGIDLAGKGGLVWIKPRASALSHTLTDTVRGRLSLLVSNTAAAQSIADSGYNIQSFNSNGFTLDPSWQNGTNSAGQNNVSWTFRKAAKFFDIVTWTGTNNQQTFSHNLGVKPGMIIVVNLNGGYNKYTWHNSIPSLNYLMFDGTGGAAYASGNPWITEPTATHFTAGGFSAVQLAGNQFVAYLFAHDPSPDGLIKCGSCTINENTGLGYNTSTVNLGFEPQWLLIKRIDSAGSWAIWDNTRGMAVSSQFDGGGPVLYPDSDSSEVLTGGLSIHANGFNLSQSDNATYVYVAIRRPNKPPTSGTQVFMPVYEDSTTPAVQTPFVVDMGISKRKDLEAHVLIGSRLQGSNKMFPAYSDVQGADPVYKWDYQNGYKTNAGLPTGLGINWAFKRAPGFFDAVCYTGNYAGNPQIAHNLTVAPELIIAKVITTSGAWYINSPLIGDYQLAFNASSKSASSTYTLTSTYFQNPDINYPTGNTFIAYLFATLAGISKVGSYTGNGSSQNIECGFAAGARFILIKRTDATGDWYVWDTARGIVSANEPHLSLNTPWPEVTTDDSVDPYSAGFIVNQVAATNINVTSATYIFLAIA